MSENKRENYDYLMHSASANDQTGLIPSGITSDAEMDSYLKLYPVYPPPLVKLDQPRATNKSDEDQQPPASKTSTGKLPE